ncbi:hypothetical protein D9M70_578830 [compost metagenome]
MALLGEEPGGRCLNDAVEDNLVAPPHRQEIIEEWLDTHSLEELIETSVERATSRADGNVAGAARLLGVTRRQLEHRLKKHV